MTDSEARHASGSWTLTGEDNDVVASGEGDLVVTDDELRFGPRAVAHLDADALLDHDRTIEIDLWPSGRVVLSMLGRRHDTFGAALASARQARRVEGMLAHGIDAPLRFRGAVVGSAFAAADLLLYPTHLTVAPESGDPWQIPLGSIRAIDRNALDWTVDVEAGGTLHRFGQLARETEAFAIELRSALESSRKALGAPPAAPFADGIGIAEAELPGFAGLVERWTARERSECVAAILARATAPRLGLVKLLDPDRDALAAREPLPPGVAAFILAPVGRLVVLEVISGPAAATYLFGGEPGAINADLQQLHFRRRPLTLPDAELIDPASPYRLAARRLAPLLRLRGAAVARIAHDASWPARFEAEVARA